MADENLEPKKTLVDRLKASAAAAVEFVKGVVQFDAFAKFKADGREIDFPIDFDADTVLATQGQMAELFAVSKPTINEHLQNLFKTGELDEKSVVRNSRITAADGKSEVVPVSETGA